MTMEKWGGFWNDGSDYLGVSPKTEQPATPSSKRRKTFPLSTGQLSLYDMKMQIFLQTPRAERLMKDEG